MMDRSDLSPIRRFARSAVLVAWVAGGLACAGRTASRGLVGGPPAPPSSASPSASAAADRAPAAPDIAAELGRRDASIREAAMQRASGAPPALVDQRIASMATAIGAALDDKYPLERITAEVAAAVDDATRDPEVQRAADSVARQRAFHDRHLARPAGLEEALDSEADAIDRIAHLRNDRATASEGDTLMVEVARRVVAKVPGVSEARVRMDLLTWVNRRQAELLRGTDRSTFRSRLFARSDGPLRQLAAPGPSDAELASALEEARSGHPDRAVAAYRAHFERNESLMSLTPSEAFDRGPSGPGLYRATVTLLDVIASVAEANPRDARAVRLAYEATLATRSRSLEAQRRLSSALVVVDAPEARTARARLLDVRARIGAIELQRAAGAAPLDGEKDERARLAEEEQRLHQVLARAAHVERTKDAAFDAAAGVDALRAGLADGEVVLSYVEYRQANLAHGGDRYWWPRRYGVFALTRSGLSWAPLGEAEAIDRELEGYLRLVADARAPLASKRAEASRLWQRLLSPMASPLASARALRIYSDGALQLLPFAALDDGRGWMGEHYELSYGVAERLRLGEHPRRPRAGDSLIVVGGPYGTMTGPRFTAGQRLRPDHFPPLAGLKAEGERIKPLLSGARLLQPGEVSEDFLYGPGAPPLVLHIAAHGVFLPLAQVGAPDARGLVLTSSTATQGLASAPRPPVPSPLSYDPAAGLLRSALVLGGGAPTESSRDGFLTGYEVASADLWGTELVVLSACESGRGSPDRVNGVQGLRAAFFAAGARTLVTSLWSVDDEATAEMMESFYRSLRQGASRAEALARASASVRVKRPDPFYWAPFILLGDTGPMPSPDGSTLAVAGDDEQSRRRRAMAARRRGHTIAAVGASSWTLSGIRDTALDDHVQRSPGEGGSLSLNLIGDATALAFTLGSYHGPGVYRIGENLAAGGTRTPDPVTLQIKALDPSHLDGRAVRGRLTVDQDDSAHGVVGSFELELVNGATAAGTFAVPSLLDVLPPWLLQHAPQSATSRSNPGRQ